MTLRHQVRDVRHRVALTLNEHGTQLVQKYIYRFASRRLRADDVVFLNYGYEEEPAMRVPLSAEDEPSRYSIQLYHRTATQADLTGTDVLEVGCGHGGGASYLTRTFRPASYTGLDLNPTGIEYCRSRHRVPNLEFRQGDAEELPFADAAFDVVVNVESSHLYPRFPRFLAEVARVLRPGGSFVYADARQSHEIPEWEAALAAFPLRMDAERTINADVMRGMEMILEQWQGVIDRVVPAPARKVVRTFAPAQRAYEGLRTGGPTEYRMYCFTKPSE